jgi:hypothetical protein
VPTTEPPPTPAPGTPVPAPASPALGPAADPAELAQALAGIDTCGPVRVPGVVPGRFPVAGVASYINDWHFPRYVPVFHLHQGTDIFASRGTPVRSPADGTVRVNVGPVGGLTVYVTEADGTYYYMAHLDSTAAGLTTGMIVRIGDVVGYVGDSGNAKGGPTHLHFEVHPNGGAAINPKPVLDRWLAEAANQPGPAADACAVPDPLSFADPATLADVTAVAATDADTAAVVSIPARPAPAPAVSGPPVAAVGSADQVDLALALVGLALVWIGLRPRHRAISAVRGRSP